MADDDEAVRERRFFEAVGRSLAQFLESRGFDAVPPSGEIEFPSASLDAEARPRFTMVLPASLIQQDLGAAHVFYHDVVGRGFEFGLRRFLDLHLRSDDVFIDVGAHYGVHSLTAATLLPHQVSVVAIEAHPENSARLRRWIELNHLESDVEVIRKAIGDQEGNARLWLSGSSMGHSLRSDWHEPGSVPVDVPVTTIDHVINERPHLRWRRFVLKIDVEGNELEALTGARELFSREDVAAVIWEKSAFHPPAEQARRDSAVWEFLDSRGFRHFHMEHEDKGGRLLPLESRDGLRNVFSLTADLTPKATYG